MGDLYSIQVCSVIAVVYYFINDTVVTGFGKTCIVHTFDFAHLEVHESHKQWCKDLNLSGMINE